MGRPSNTAMSTLTGTVQIVTNWDRGARGKDDRVQMRLYATLIAIAMGCTLTGESMDCLHCGNVFHVPSEGDVDRTDASVGYSPGNVVMVCRRCNETRGHLQQALTDLGNADQYISDVRQASMGIDVPTKAYAKAVKSTWHGIIRQRVGGIAWAMELAKSPYA